MGTVETAGLGRGTRWLLLFCTLFGLATMHTLGHAGVTGHLHAHIHSEASPAMIGPVLTEAAAMPCDDCGGHDGMSGWSVCLAVLGGLALLLLVAALLPGRLRDPRRRASGAAGPAASRSPPARRTGLRVASLAVLRV